MNSHSQVLKEFTVSVSTAYMYGLSLLYLCTLIIEECTMYSTLKPELAMREPAVRAVICLQLSLKHVFYAHDISD